MRDSHPYELTVIEGRYAICRLDAAEAIPAWVTEPARLLAVTRTADELSLVCDEARVPHGTTAQTGYCALKVHGPLPLNAVGVMAALSGALAHAGVSLFAISTFDTDYLLVHTRDLARAVRALRHEGHTVHTP